MHELAVTESILDIASRHAVQANAAQVTDIYLVIGQLSSIVDESVQFYWDIISQQSICEKARLHFKRIPARLSCLDCGKEYTIEKGLEVCPECHSANVIIQAGEEFYMDSIEIQK